jgi:hypothetical protein
VLRETHRHLQAAYERPELRRQDREKLAAAEADLDQAARHLYARIAAEMENTDVAVVLDQLARASEALEAATRTLRGEAAPVPPEQEALAELVLTRKAFQKTLADGQGGGDPGPEGEELVTVELPDKLKEVAEFRDEQKAVKEQLEALAARQRRLAEQARKSGPGELASLAVEEEEIARDLREAAATHPRAWKGADEESTTADESLARAAKAMRETSPGAADEAQAAAAAIGALENAVGRLAEARGLEDAYRLKEMVEAHARALGRIEATPEGYSAGQVAAAAGGARDTTRELKKLVEETPAGEAFGPALRDAVRTGEQDRRERALDGVATAAGPEERRAAAATGRRSLEDLSQAFEKSAPSAARESGGGDPLRASGHDAFALALRQLESLAAAEASGRATSPEGREKQRREALHNLRAGAEALYGKDPKTADFLVKVDQELKGGDAKVDAARMRRLVEQIERFRVEMGDPGRAQGRDARARHIDPAHLPPAYRDRIQRYFQQLSEEDRP